MQHKLSAIAGVVSVSLFLSACGSSDDEDVPLLPNATSSGVISGFGSVYVNGLRYVTESASIRENGSESSEEALQLGMKVIINANQSANNDPTALEVKYIADAIGEIKAIDLVTNSLTILGQTYFITDATKFDSVTFNELRLNDIVELSAFEDDQGTFVVSYLTANDEATEHQLLGTVSKLSKITQTFYIGSLLVDYADAEVKGSFSNGVKVSIKSDAVPNSGEFSADEVSVQGLVLVIGGTLTVSGVIDDFNRDERTIEIEGRKYILADASDFTQGDEDSLSEGDQVSLIATVIQGESELQTPSYPITSIRVELDNEVSLEGIVAGITDTGFIIFSQAFTVDEYTQYKDDSAQALRYFNLADIAIDDKLAIDAYEVDGVLISRKVEREGTGVNDSGPHEVEGIVDNINVESFTFSVNGIQVLTNDDTDFEDAYGNSANQAEFFSTLVLNAEVEVEITANGNDWLALDVEVDGETKDKEIELVGRIDSVLSDNTFIVNGHQVMTSEQTAFENGSKINMVKGALIEVEGVMGVQGLLFAQEVEFLDAEED